GGQIDLCSTGALNAVGTFAASDSAAGAAILFGDTVALTIGAIPADACANGATGVATTNGNISITSAVNGGFGSLTINNPISAGTGTVGLTGGRISQAATGAISAQNLGVIAATVILDQAAN